MNWPHDAKPLPVNASKDAAFLAGWLALRKLGDARLAQQHFLALQETADGPLSRAKALYWLGRTSEALADPDKARAYYRDASKYVDTFHGQLARLKLDPDRGALDLKPPAAPTPEEIARFNGLDAVKAAVFAHKAGLDASIERAFLFHLRNYFDTEAEVAMVAHLAEAFGDTQTAVRVGKTGVARGMNLIYYAYPIHALPAYTPLRRPPEPAFILGIARQESEFNTKTLSGAGARGILQVMPITARHVCHDYKIKCNIERLMQDPAYNTMMGSAYISDRMDEFSGSYILAIAGYNAGPDVPGNGSRSLAIRAMARLTRSTGSSASRSKRRASTCRRFSPTSRSIAPGLAMKATPCASSPTCTGHGGGARAAPLKLRRRRSSSSTALQRRPGIERVRLEYRL